MIKGWSLVAGIFRLGIVEGWCCPLSMSLLCNDSVASIEEKQDAFGNGPLIMMMCYLEQSRTPRDSTVEALKNSGLPHNL